MSPSKRNEDRVRCLGEAAKYYEVARNFEGVGKKGFDEALRLLDEVGDSIIAEDEVDSVVCGLARKFKEAYVGKRKSEGIDKCRMSVTGANQSADAPLAARARALRYARLISDGRVAHHTHGAE